MNIDFEESEHMHVTFGKRTITVTSTFLIWVGRFVSFLIFMAMIFFAILLIPLHLILLPFGIKVIRINKEEDKDE